MWVMRSTAWCNGTPASCPLEAAPSPPLQLEERAAARASAPTATGKKTPRSRRAFWGLSRCCDIACSFIISLLQYCPHPQKAVLRQGSVGQDLLLRERRLRLVRPHDVLEGESVGGRGHSLRVHLPQDLKVVDDGGELLLELCHVLLAEAQSSQAGDVEDLRSIDGQGSTSVRKIEDAL